MDFHSMNRKQLQTLCKRHKIPANLSNLEMANRLTKFLKEENVSEIESVGEVVNKKNKKVRFSPEHELFEFTRSPIQIKRRSRRNSVSGRDNNWSIEMEAETVGREGSTAQTGELKLVEAEVKQNKRGRKAVKCSDGKKVASAVDSCEDGQLVTEVRPVRMTRLRGKTEAEGEMICAKDDYKRDEKASDRVKNAGNTEIAENHSRVTRSKAQKVTEAPAAKEKKGRKEVKNIGKVAAVRAETGDNRNSLSKRGDEGEGKSAMGSDERSAGEHVTVEPQLALRRSKRKVNGVGGSEMLICDTREHEKVKGSTKTFKLLASGVPEVDTEISGVEGDQGRGAVLKIEEPIQKMEPRRSNRRKTVIDYTRLIGDTLRSSLTQSDIVPEASKDEKMVIQPIGVTRRSGRKTLSVKMVSTIDTDSAVENLNAEKPKSESCLGEKEIFAVVQKNTRVTRNTSKCKPPGSLDKVGTDSAAENIVAEKHISESCLGEKENVAAVQKNMRLTRNTSKCKPPGPLDKIGGDSNIHQKNKVTKRKRVHVSGDAMIKNNDTISGEQSLKGRSSEEVVSPTAKGKFSDEMTQPHRLDKPQTLDTSSHHNSSGIGVSLFLNVQLSVSKDSESANNLCSKNIISDVDLTSIKETHEMKEEVSAADSADNSCMNLANEGKLVNSNANAASTSKSAARGTESSASEDQICNSSIVEVKEGKLLWEFDVHESVEQNIKEVGRNGSEAWMYSQAEDSGCNNKINDQVFAEGLNVPEEEGSAETCSSADSFLNGDQSDVKTDLEVAETEVDEHVQPCVSLVDHHNDQDDLELGASSNILDINNEDTSRTPGAFKSCGTDYTYSKSSSKLKVPSLGMTVHHVDDVAKGFETFFHNSRASESAEADEGGCSKDQSNSSDQFNESNMPELCHSERNAGIVSPDKLCTDSTGVNLKKGHDDVQVDKLFDQEGRYRITPQEKENFSGEHSVEDFNEQGLSQHDSPSIAPTTMYNSTGDHKSSNSQETDPSSPSCVSETQAEKQKSLVANSNELAPSNKRQVTLSSASELAGNAVCFLKSSEMKHAGGLIADEDVNDENYDIDEEVSAEASISHVKSCSVNKIAAGSLGDVKFQDTAETVHEHKNLVARKTESDADEEASLATSRQIWTEAELQNLFGTSDEYAPPGLSDTFCQGSERANMTMSENKSTPSISGILTEKPEKEMDEESGIESDANIYGNALESLFATPVKITPCKTEETYSHGSILDGSVMSVQEGSVTMKGNVPTGVTSNEKAQNAGYEIENNLGTGAALPSHGGDGICEDVNEVESFDRVLDGSATSIQEWSEAMKENVATDVTSNEKENTAGYEIGGNLGTGAALSDNGGDDICEDVNKVERVLDGSVTSIQECSEAMKENVATDVTSNEKENTAGYEIEGNLGTGAALLSDNCGDDIWKDVNEVERVLDGSVTSIQECSEAMKENVATDVTSNEKENTAGYEIGGNLGTGAALSDNGGDDICEDVNEVERVLDGSVTSIQEYSEAMKENVATGVATNEKAHNAGYEVESNLGTGVALSNNGGDAIFEDVNEVESVELLNTFTGVLFEAEYDGCEALEDQLTHSKEECLLESNSITEEDIEEHAIPLAESCLNDEETEKSIISVSGSPRDLYELMSESRSCKSEAHNKFKGEMTQSTTSELSDANLQKSEVPENSHLPAACTNDHYNLRETSIKTSNEPEVENIGSSNRGISSLISLKVSPDCEESILGSDDQYEAKKLDEQDGNPKCSQDISDELHTTSEVAIQGNVSIGYNNSQELEQLVSSDELDSISKEAKGMETTTQTLNNTDAVAEHGSFACRASGGDKKLETGEPVLKLDEEKVQDAGFELENSSCVGDLLSDDGGEDTCGKMNDEEEQLPENTEECQKGASFIPEDNEEKVTSPETDSSNELTEEYLNILSGTPKNLDINGGCQDMLFDNALSESVIRKSIADYKSEQEIIQGSEVEDELSDADLQKSNISKNSQNVIDEGTYLPLSSEASPVSDELTQNKICGVMICDEVDTKGKSSQDVSDESHTNSEVAILKSLSDSNDQTEDAGRACSLELERTSLEINEAGTATQDLNKGVGPRELLLHARDEKSDSLKGDNSMKDIEEAETLTTQMVQFPVERHFEKNVEDFKNYTIALSNSPASGSDGILRESDVADTIKEYIDSESSLPVIFENSGASLPSDMLADTDEAVASEKSAMSIYEKDIAARRDCLTPMMEISSHSSKDEDTVPSLECLNTEQEEDTLSIRPAQVSEKAANSPERIDEGNTIKLDAVEDGHITACSTMRKNARTILIHGTPGKLIAADMKENELNQKRSNIGYITAARPAKRRPLQDLQGK
ncbi:uncharacterized protein LOC125221845 isoform X2 [Salvia hispanica]|uniref:uncharacterized protein LOC125221845 isoform X2 n=1 Tax=Salvia hispanica TaxID=49212 RepID=UPI0020098C8A|nr:uncharacterized protein LOC125221845 isoform X2 [Salvia hispanica]